MRPITGLSLAAGSGAEKYVMKYEICNFGAFLTHPPSQKEEEEKKSPILSDRSKKGFVLAEPGKPAKFRHINQMIPDFIFRGKTN